MTIDNDYSTGDILPASWVVDVANAINELTEGPSGTPIGALTDWGGDVAPEGWLLCDGSTVVRATYPELFAVLSTRFNTGGESGSEFRLPDFSDRVALGAGSKAVGTQGGSNNAAVVSHKHTMGNHSHTLSKHKHSINHNHGAANTSKDGAHSHKGIKDLYGNQLYGADGSFWSATGSTAGLRMGSPYTEIQVQSTSSTHTHSFNMPNFTGTSGEPSNNSTNAVDPGDTNSAGSSGTDKNLPQYVAVHKIIKAT